METICGSRNQLRRKLQLDRKSYVTSALRPVLPAIAVRRKRASVVRKHGEKQIRVHTPPDEVGQAKIAGNRFQRITKEDRRCLVYVTMARTAPGILRPPPSLEPWMEFANIVQETEHSQTRQAFRR